MALAFFRVQQDRTVVTNIVSRLTTIPTTTGTTTIISTTTIYSSTKQIFPLGVTRP